MFFFPTPHPWFLWRAWQSEETWPFRFWWANFQQRGFHPTPRLAAGCNLSSVALLVKDTATKSPWPLSSAQESSASSSRSLAFTKRWTTRAMVPLALNSWRNNYDKMKGTIMVTKLAQDVVFFKSKGSRLNNWTQTGPERSFELQDIHQLWPKGPRPELFPCETPGSRIARSHLFSSSFDFALDVRR